MKGRKELWILGGILLLSLLYILLHREDRYGIEIPSLPELDLASLDRVTLAGPKGEISFRKDGDQWLLAEGAYRVDEQKMKDLLKSVGELTLRELASEAQSYHRFGLDKEERIEVAAFSGDTEIRRFWVGKSASTYQHTYVQLPEDEHVYMAKDDFRRHLEQDAQGFRDLVVLRLPEETLARMERSSRGSVDLSLTRKAEKAPSEKKEDGQEQKEEGPVSGAAWVLGDERPANQDTVAALLRQIRDMRCESFLVGKTAQDFPAVEQVWTFVQKDGGTVRLTVHSKQDEKTEQYVASVEGVAEPFLISSWALGELLKGAEAFQPAPKAPSPAPAPPAPSPARP